MDSVKLDPLPYKWPFDGSRTRNPEYYHNTHLFIFDPRPEYSQNIEDYQ